MWFLKINESKSLFEIHLLELLSDISARILLNLVALNLPLRAAVIVNSTAISCTEFAKARF